MIFVKPATATFRRDRPQVTGAHERLTGEENMPKGGTLGQVVHPIDDGSVEIRILLFSSWAQ
jgi:hypothetical protein